VEVVATPRAVEHIRRQGGTLWVWLDPHQCLVGAYTYLEAHTQPPGTSFQTKFTRASRLPHRFLRVPSDGFELYFDPGKLDPPEELHVDLRGWRNKRIEAYWNGCVFVGEDVPAPGRSEAIR
jgi:hypothetical protein